jgi:hypothetical protein
MPFTVRTAKAHRQAKLAALHAAHVHVEGYVAAADDSDEPRYADHWFVTNQEGFEDKPGTACITCPTEATANQVAVILNEARTHGYWKIVRRWDKVAMEWVIKSKTWTKWADDMPVPIDVVRLISEVLHPAWVDRVKPKTLAPPAAVA